MTAKLTVSLLALSLAGAGAGGAAPALADTTPQIDSLNFFQTPSHRISCVVTNHKSVRCDGPDRHPGPRPKRCFGDFPGAFYMNATGRASRICVSDAARKDNERTLAYGKTVHDGAITCLSSVRGMYCHNRSHHGWKISVLDSHLF